MPGESYLRRLRSLLCWAHTVSDVEGRGTTDYNVAAEGVKKRAASEPFGTICQHTVTKRAGVTKHAASASRLTRFVTLVSERTVVTKHAASASRLTRFVTLVSKCAGVTKRAVTWGRVWSWRSSRLVCDVNRFRLFGKVWHLCFILFSTSEEVGVML